MYATGQVQRLNVILSKENLRAVKKAINQLQVVVVSIEMTVAHPGAYPPITVADRTLYGCELVKTYTSARWHDVANLDANLLLLTDRYWVVPAHSPAPKQPVQGGRSKSSRLGSAGRHP